MQFLQIRMLCDLNIRFPVTDFNQPVEPAHIAHTKTLINQAIDLGYTHLAINFCPKTPTSLTNSNKISANLNEINPINLERDFKEYADTVKLYSRITVKVDDPGQCQNFAKFQQLFDLIAIEPLTEKSFQSCISNLEIDIISFNLLEKFPCFMKHKTLGSAIEKGIKFEINYTAFLKNPSRALAISNAKQIIRASRGSGMICSSGAQFGNQLRNFHNIKPLLKLLSVKDSNVNMMFNGWCLKVLMRGRLRIKSYKQTVAIVDKKAGASGILDGFDSNGSNVNHYKKRKPGHKGEPAVKRLKI